MDISKLTDSEFIDRLESGGCALRAVGDRLRCVVPGGGVLDEELRSEISRRKDGLLELLRRRRIGLSFEQERLWFLDSYSGPRDSAYHMPAAFRVRGDLDIGALERSLADLVARHESLRTVFKSEHGKPYQEILPPAAVRLREEPIDEDELERVLAVEAMRPFDLAKGPLTRIRLLRPGERDHVLVFCQHHIIGDGWSTGIILDELSESYAALVSGLADDIPTAPLQYADYALWQRTGQWSERQRPQEEYWSRKLEGLDEVEVLPDLERPPVKTYRGERLGFDIDEKTAAAVADLADAEGATPFMVLLTALTALLQRLCARDDIAIGTPVANRGGGDLERTVGFFVNTLVMRTRLDGNPSFREALRRVRQTCLEAYANPELPFGRLVDLLAAERDPARSPLFGVLFVLRHESESGLRLAGCAVEEIKTGYPTAKFDLAFEMSEDRGRLEGEVEYNTDLYLPETVGRIAAGFTRMLSAGCSGPDVGLRDIDILTQPEKERLLYDFNETEAPFPHKSLPDLFREQALETPGSAALVFGDTRITYEELDRQSDGRAASLLQALGVTPGDTPLPDTIVGVPATTGPGGIISILGILKAGCAYLPLDLDYPPERLAFLLEDSRASAVLAAGEVTEKLDEVLATMKSRGASELPVVVTGVEGAAGRSDTGPEGADPRSIAYVIYTSGSTGDPKGVLLEHRGVSNLVAAQCETFQIDSSSRVLQFAPLSFDASVSEIFTALLSGAELHLLPDDVKRDPDRLIELIERRGITTATLPPALLSVLPHKKLPTLKTLVAAGDVCDEETMKRWAAGRRLVNAYGPTEATVCASMCVWHEGASQRNIGPPMKNVKVFVLDPDMRPVPRGMPGELYVSGPGLARGYLNRPSLDEECFVSNPFEKSGTGDHARLYRTGDTARWLSGGELEFLGRTDDQVKVRGYRVEPGEIEAAMKSHPAVARCVVAPVSDETSGRLAAWWVAADGYTETPSSDMRDFLSARLPAYMVPSAFIRLDELPLTSSGKVDRKALPAFDPRESLLEAESRPPETATEKKLAGIWEQVLKLEGVGTAENFFSLGGDSIMSIQVVSRAREAGLELDPKDLFAYPTISALAARADRQARKRVSRRKAKGDAPLTPIQRWFFELDMPDVNHFNQSVLLRLDCELDAELLREAARRLAKRHDSLRLRFEKDGEWRQHYAEGPGALDLPVHEIDLSGRAGGLAAECERLQSSLDITSGPVAAIGLFNGMPDSRQRLLIAIHHLVVDAVSWTALLDDLTSICAGLLAGKPVRFGSRRGSSFQQWGEALHRYLGDKAVEQWDRWLEVVAGARPIEWELGGGVATYGELLSPRVELSEDQTASLMVSAPGAYHAGARDLLVAALLLAWHRLFSSNDLLLDLEGHGREGIYEAVDVTRTSGWFTSLYPVRIEVPPAKARGEDDAFYSALIKAVKEKLRAVPDGGLGYGVLRYMSGDRRASLLKGGTAAEVSFNYLGRTDFETRGPLAGAIERDGAGRPISPANPAPHPVEVNALVDGGRLRVEFSVSPRHLGKETADRLAMEFRKSLLELTAHCMKPGSGGHTPSDFPLARLTQAQVDELTAREETESIYGLTPMQEGLLFHALYAPGSDQYLEQLCWTYKGTLDADALKKAWARIIERHGVFRTAFFYEGLERPVQVVRRKAPLDWREEDWRGLPAGQLEEELAEYLARDRLEGFDLRRAGLNRFHLIRVNEEEYRFIWCFHHILMDGWCSSLLLNELQLRYEALTGGRAFRLPPPPPFEEYVAWLSSRDTAEDDEFWRSLLAGVDEPTPLGMNRRPLEILRPIDEVDEGIVHFSEADTEEIVAFARDNRVTVNSLLQTAWALVLSAYSGRPNVVIGVNVSGRPGELAGVEKMVGMFVNAVPVRFVLEPRDSALDAVKGMNELMQEIGGHSYGSLADIQRFSGVPAGTPLFFSEYVFENYPLDDSVLAGPPGLSVSGFHAVEKTNYPLALMAAPGRELAVKATFDVESFSPGSIRRMLAHMKSAIGHIVHEPSSRVGEVDIMPVDEKETILRQWSGAEVETPADSPSVMGLFEARALEEPDRLAVSCAGERMKYGELLALSRRVSAALENVTGEGRGRMVGLCMTRGPKAVAGILGILGSGAAYVPMDPTHPDDRLRFTTGDAGLKAIVTDKEQLPRLQQVLSDQEQVELLCIEELVDGPGIGSLRRPGPDDTAYVIYTSGSTGTPKGVLISHRNLSDHTAAVVDLYSITADDVVLQFSTLTFDTSMEQIFLTLSTGATLAMRGEPLWTPAELKEVIASEGVTVMNLPTGYFREVVADWSADPGDLPASKLRLVLTGGDALDTGSARAWMDLPLPPHRFLNAYGPTETTVTATTFEISGRPERNVPIGKPVGARRLYILGGDGRPVPPGIPGELCIGGIGVSPGYLGRPEVTAAGFGEDPFASTRDIEHGYGHLYRTGDIARWRDDGNLEFVGRTDFQAKVRGFRVEPGEIEAVLARHPALSTCAVVVSSEGDGRELVAYYVPGTISEESGARVNEAATEAVSSWETVYDELFERGPGERGEDAFDTTGWNSSYDGSPIPEEQMREWVDSTVDRILELHPRSVFEVGCGTGLIMTRVAPHAKSYLGVDFSAPAVSRLRDRLARDPIPGADVLQMRADGMGDIVTREERFPVDTVVINSVIQYFPAPEYLERVLEQALEAVADGSIFIGDVRDLRLQDAFHLSVETAKAGGVPPAPGLRGLLERDAMMEKELLVSPLYFLDFAARHDRVGGVSVMPKTGGFSNEMNDYRFDVVMKVSGAADDTPAVRAPEKVDWAPDLDLDSLLASSDCPVVVSGYPNRRVWTSYGISVSLDGGHDLEDERARLDGEAEGFLSIEQLAATGKKYGYRIFPRLRLAGEGAPALLDLYYSKDERPPTCVCSTTWSRGDYANRPLDRFLKQAIDPEELREFLSGRLPDYMVPSFFVELDSLPLTPAGKPDRNTLALLGRQATPALEGYVAPRDEQERLLANIFSDVLSIDRVGIADDFFRLGGHSLSATRVVSRIQKVFGVQCPVKSIFEHPRIVDLAPFISRLAGGAPARPPLVRTADTDRAPLSFAQERLWFLDRFESVGESSYHMPSAFRIEGPLDVPALERSLDALTARHESLRTVFSDEGGEPYQVVLAPVTLELEIEEVAPEELAAALDRLIRLPFDLEAGPLFRVHVIQTGEDEHVLLINQHHIISDAWSVGVLFEELSRCYQAFSRGEEVELAPLAVSYSDFALWQKGWLKEDVLQSQLDYWREKLEGAPRLELPAARPRGERTVRRGKQLAFRLDPEDTARLRRVSRDAGASMYMVLLAAFSFLLGHYSAEEDVVVGTVVAGRTEEALENIVGFFINTLLLRVDLSDDPSFGDLLERVRKTSLEAFAHQDLPFEKLVAELRPERGGGSNPLLGALLVYQNAPGTSLELEGLEVSPVALELGAVRSDLDLYAWEESGALEFCLVYDEDLFDDESVDRMAKRLTGLMTVASKDASSPLSGVSLLDESEVPRPPVPSPQTASERAPLSYHQERLWFIDFFEEETVYEGKPTYHNMPLVIAFDGPVDARVMESSLHDVIQRHGALRTRIVTGDDGAFQSVEPEWRPPLEVIEAPEADLASLKEKALEFAGRSFSASEEPRVRAALLSGKNGTSVFVLVVHHVLADQRSLAVIADELAESYSAAVAGGVPGLRPEVLTCQGFSQWQRGVPEHDWEPLVYEWKWRLRGDLPKLTLPEDRPRPAIHTYTAGVVDFPLPPELIARLEDLSRREGIDTYTVLLAGLAITLLCYSGQEELIVGTFGNGRPDGAESSVGPLDNLLPIRARPAAEDTFRGFAGSLAAVVDEARANGALPFDLLVEKLSPPVDMSRTALFDVLFDYRPGRDRPLRFGETNADLLETNTGLGKYDLNVLLTGVAGRVNGTAAFNADIYDGPTAAAMMSRFETVLDNLVASPDIPLKEVSFLTSEEERRQTVGWNDTAASFPERATLHGLFAEQARRTPENIAVSCGETGISYRELNERACRLAGYLKRLGVGPDRLVALFLERSIDAVVAMLAVLKAGGAYLPIEVSLPEDRATFIIEDSRASVLVTTAALSERVAFDVASVVLLDADRDSIAAMPSTIHDPGTRSDNLAYCIYTSGSTGRPKGVLIEHRNVVHLLKNDRLPFEFSSSDVWTMFHSYGFDFSVWEMYGALLTGGRLVVVPVETTRDSSLLLDLIEEEGVTILNQVPSAFYGLSREALERGGTGLPLRYVIFGGEALDYGMLDTWQKSYPAISLVNMYGITETCVHVTFKEVNEEDIAAGVCNIGRPLPDTTLYVTDPYLRMLPAGLPGEMCVGGGGVARGYLGRDELTVDRFVPDPFRPGSRLYRSGDVGRYLQNGELEYLGRLDSQVQIRGFRVEPGEIENRLGEHPAVSRAAVRVWGRHVDGEPSDGSDKIVVAYYVLSPVATRGKEPGAEDLKWFLTERLPGYMVPSYVIRMDALPVTTGGKVDRKLLPDPRSAVLAAGETIAPRDPVELSLLEIWEDLIGVHIGSIDADFFLCGGHSLLAVKLISRINRLFGTSYAVSWAFVNKTIEKQARALREAGGSTPFRPLVAFNRKGDKPPLFFVHPGQAGAEAYSRLASLLDAARPFYAIESRNLYDQKRPMLRTVESLSDAYISDILSLCGEGPCLLGGWSFGGLVAFEMARVMLERGIEVGGLFLIDAFYHDSEERELLSELAKSTELSDLLAGNALYGDLPEKYRSRLVDVTRLEFEAMALYEARPFAGRALLIKPSEERPAPGTQGAENPLVETLFSRYSMSADNGWSSQIGNLEIHPVPGDHITMMEGRGLKEIARIVSGPRT